MRIRYTLLLILAGCGGGGSDAVEAPALSPRIDAVTSPLTSLGGDAFVITGGDLTGAPGDAVTVRFIATTGVPFGPCLSDTLETTGTLVSDARVEGITPATVLVGDVDTYVSLRLPGGTEVRSAVPLARFLGVPSSVFDQDLNGIADGCDPNTYDFEGDAVGQAPADVRALGGADPSFVVKDVVGDKAVHYTSAAPGQISHRLERVEGDYPHQDLTAYIDFEDIADFAHVEFWSDGSYFDNAGAGLLLQVHATGAMWLFQRTWRSIPAVAGPSLPASGRIRVRLIKDRSSTSSTMHVDAWESGAWAEDHAVFTIADDRWFTGTSTTIPKYGVNLRGIKRITVVHAPATTALELSGRPARAMDWKLFQRDASDVATIPVDFRYTLTAPGRVEARVIDSQSGLPLTGHDWGVHAAALPAAESARASLDVTDVPMGGNYDIQLRLLSAAGGVLGQVQLQELAVGDVYIAIGQSNMSGYSGSLGGATAPLDQVHLFGNDAAWKQATEPMDAGLYQRDRVSYENPAHSLMLPFARALYEATNVPIAIIPGPLGGTNLYAQWQRNGTTPDWRATLYGATLWRVREQYLGAKPRGILWFQGESDAISARTTAQYRADLEQLLDQYRTDLAAPDLHLFCAQLGTFTAANLALWLPVQEAQRQVAANDDKAALITTVDQPLADAIHFNVAGYQAIGRRFADAAHAQLYGGTHDPLTELVSATGSGSTITLTYDANVQGGAAALYAVNDDSGAPGITGLVVSGSTVTLQLDRALDTNATVSYGYSTAYTAGWLTDGAGVPVPCFADVPVGP